METVEHGNPLMTTPEGKKLAIRMAIVFGVITILALYSLVYAFKQKSEVEVQAKRADSLQVLSDSLYVQVQKYKEASIKQQKANEHAAKIAQQKAEAAKKHTAKPAPKLKKMKPKK